MRPELETIEMVDPADVEMREVDSTHDETSHWVDLALEDAPTRDPEAEIEPEAPEDALQTADRTRPNAQVPAEPGGKTVEDQSLAAAMEVIDRFHQYQRLRDRASQRTAGSPPRSTPSANTPAPFAPATRPRR